MIFSCLLPVVESNLSVDRQSQILYCSQLKEEREALLFPIISSFLSLFIFPSSRSLLSFALLLVLALSVSPTPPHLSLICITVLLPILQTLSLILLFTHHPSYRPTHSSPVRNSSTAYFRATILHSIFLFKPPSFIRSFTPSSLLIHHLFLLPLAFCLSSVLLPFICVSSPIRCHLPISLQSYISPLTPYMHSPNEPSPFLHPTLYLASYLHHRHPLSFISRSNPPSLPSSLHGAPSIHKIQLTLLYAQTRQSVCERGHQQRHIFGNNGDFLQKYKTTRIIFTKSRVSHTMQGPSFKHQNEFVSFDILEPFCIKGA